MKIELRNPFKADPEAEAVMERLAAIEDNVEYGRESDALDVETKKAIHDEIMRRQRIHDVKLASIGAAATLGIVAVVGYFIPDDWDDEDEDFEEDFEDPDTDE